MVAEDGAGGRPIRGGERVKRTTPVPAGALETTAPAGVAETTVVEDGETTVVAGGETTLEGVGVRPRTTLVPVDGAPLPRTTRLLMLPSQKHRQKPILLLPLPRKAPGVRQIRILLGVHRIIPGLDHPITPGDRQITPRTRPPTPRRNLSGVRLVGAPRITLGPLRTKRPNPNLPVTPVPTKGRGRSGQVGVTLRTLKMPRAHSHPGEEPGEIPPRQPPWLSVQRKVINPNERSLYCAHGFIRFQIIPMPPLTPTLRQRSWMLRGERSISRAKRS